MQPDAVQELRRSKKVVGELSPVIYDDRRQEAVSGDHRLKAALPPLADAFPLSRVGGAREGKRRPRRRRRRRRRVGERGRESSRTRTADT